MNNVNHIERKHVEYFVHGAVNLYCDQSGALSRTEFDLRDRYVARTLEVVWRYLQTGNGLDGSCSDMQCSVAHEAFRVFKPVKEVPAVVDGGVCPNCGEPNMAHMGGDWQPVCRRGGY